MARAQKITSEQIESARKVLQELPVKEVGKSKEDAAALLIKDIQAALKKGYTVREISQRIKQDGTPVSASLIKQCLETAAEKTRKRKKSADDCV